MSGHVLPARPARAAPAIVQAVHDGAAAGRPATTPRHCCCPASTTQLHAGIKAMMIDARRVAARALHPACAPARRARHRLDGHLRHRRRRRPRSCGRGCCRSPSSSPSSACSGRRSLLTVTRKGEPLLQALRGLGTVALWGAVGIVGTQLALRASDAYTFWILKQAIFGDSANPTDTPRHRPGRHVAGRVVQRAGAADCCSTCRSCSSPSPRSS